MPYRHKWRQDAEKDDMTDHDIEGLALAGAPGLIKRLQAATGRGDT